MKYLTIKTALHIGMIGAAVTVIAVSGGARPTLARAMEAASPFERSFVTLAARPALAGIVQTQLNDDTQRANVRSGPGLEFEVLGTVSSEETIEVIGRANSSYWLQIEWQGQLRWLGI